MHTKASTTMMNKMISKGCCGSGCREDYNSTTNKPRSKGSKASGVNNIGSPSPRNQKSQDDSVSYGVKKR